MSFDISRSTFRPRKNFLGVVMQQGRVQLDSDWNEWQSEYSRRIQAGTLDTIGQAVYPASTPNAFKITPGTNAAGNTLLIGAGRYYVDGLLAENHGPEKQAAWDPSLAEMSGAPAFSTTTAETDFTAQPYLPGATFTQGDNGPFLAYLDVWQRDVTYLEDPDLIDKAINIDTTGRLQTIWQVKYFDLSSMSPAPTCSTDIPAFDARQQPPAGRLTNGLVPNAASGPCCLAPNTGYTGQENQLYRVEIHQAGQPVAPPAGGYSWPLPPPPNPPTPTFKWSRDDASVETSVSAIATVGTVSQITVGSLGRDQVLGFAANNWIEITDDAYELLGESGEFYQIKSVNPAANTITLNGTVSSHFVLTGGLTNPKLHTRITRWDQCGQIYQVDSSGNRTPWIDLDAPDSQGQIPVPPPGTMLELENGITVSFALSPEPTAANPTTFRVGDYWLFTARTSDGSIEQITSAPPLGINHHYAKLSIVTFPSSASDCRTEWPPEQSGCGCCCNIELAPTDLTGNTTLQSILNQHQNQTTPTVICLAAGTYSLPAPLRLTSAHQNITIEACQPGSVIFQAQSGNEANFNDGMIILDGSDSITLTGLTFLVPVAPYSATSFAGLPVNSLPASVGSMVQNLLVSIGVRIVNGSTVSISRNIFELGIAKEGAIKQNSTLFAAAIFANGQSSGLEIDNNKFLTRNINDAANEIFSTGLLLAPSVSFGTPTTILSVSPSGTVVAAQNPVVAANQAKTDQPKLKTRAAAQAPSQTLAGAPKLNVGTAVGTVTERPVAEEPGLQNIGGQLQNIVSFATTTAQATLASQGGTVLAATLNTSTLCNNTFVRLTAAALLLGEPGTLDASDNTVALCRAGIWIVTPVQMQVLLTDPQNVVILGATVALGYPLPQGDTSAPTTIAASPASTFIYTGANNYTDSQGNVWVPDSPVPNVTVIGGFIAHPSPPVINETSDQPLYQSERWGTSFSYTFTNLPTGYYSLTLKFAEITHTDNSNNKGVRIFDVSVNSEPVLTNFDIVADAGAALIADDKTFSGIVPSGGNILVQFTGTSLGSDPNAKVSAAELNPMWSGAPYLGSGNESDSANFFDQLAQLSMQAYASQGNLPVQLRVQDNEMLGLSAPGLLLLGDDSLANGNSGSLMMTANRIDGEIAEEADFATFTGAAVAQSKVATAKAAGTATSSSNTLAISEIFFNPGAFYYLVTIVAVSRAVVSANMVINGNFTDGYFASIFLNDRAVQEAIISVMSNTLGGKTSIAPQRNLNDTSLDPTLQSWNFLNTIVGVT